MKHLLSLVIVPILGCCVFVGGCKSEPELVSSSEISAAEPTLVDKRTKITGVKSAGSLPARGSSDSGGISGAASRANARQTTEPTVVVYGQISRADGSPAPGVTVALHTFASAAIREGRLETDGAVASVESDAEGNYELSGPTSLGMHLQISGDVPRMQVMLEKKELYALGKPHPGLQRVKQDVTLLEPHRITGNVVDQNGKPMAGLPVHLKPKFENNDNRLFKSTETTSTASGSFEVDNVAAGSWIIGTVHPDYAAVTELIDVPATGPVTLRLGSMGGTITGHIYHKDTGSGAGGLPVSLAPGNLYALDTLEKFETKSAGDGSFRFDKVSSGPKRLMMRLGDNPKLGLAMPVPPTIQVEEKQTTDVTLFVYPGHTITGRIYDKDINEPLPGAEVSKGSFPGATAEKIMSDSAGQYTINHVFPAHSNRVGLEVKLEGFKPHSDSDFGNQNLSVNLSEDEITVTRDIPMVKTIRIKGIVVTKDGMPVPHATVNLFNNRTHSSTDEKKTVNADGTFELDSVPFVSAVIEAEATGFGSVVSDTIDLTTKDVDGIKLVMEPGAVVQGRVLNPEGEPVPEASVYQSKQYGIFGTSREAAKSGKDGNYMLRDMPKQVSLKAKKEGFAESEELEFSVNPGETKTGADIILRQGFSIAGKVITAKGEPVPKASVHAQGDNIFEHKNAEADGTFEISGLAEGVYRVTASGAGGYKNLENIKTGTTDLEIVLGGNDPSGNSSTVKFTGTVVDDASGDPIRDFTVDPNTNIKVKKLPGPGKFELEGVQTRHVYTLKISSPDFEEQSFQTESSSNGEDIEQTFKLGRGGAITGRVIEKGSGNPIADLVVVNWGTSQYYERQRKGPENHTTTDDQGKFVLAPAPSGKNTVEIKASDPYTEVAKAIEVQSEEVADLGDIELSRGGTITGTVIQGADELPVPGKQVSLSGWSEEMQVNKKVTSDSDGRFEFTGLPAMNFTVRVESTYKSVQLAAEGSEDVQLILGGVTVRGNITRGDTPVRASVSATGPNDIRINNYAQSGEYIIKSVPPGTYDFEVRPQEGNYNNPLKVTVEVPDQEEFVKDFQLPDGGLIVTVTNAAGELVEGATVNLSQKSSNTGFDQRWLSRAMDTKRSSVDGKVEFAGLDSGVFSVSGQKDGVGSAMKPNIEVAAEQKTNVELQLSADGGTLVSMALSYTTGQGVQEAWCYLHGENGPFTHSAQRDASGMMVIENIPPGTYTTNVSYWSHSQSEKQVEIKANETVQIEDVLYPAGALHWTLKKADGSPAGGAAVTVTPVTSDPPEEQRSGQSGPNGLFVQRGLAAGTYQVTAQLPGKPAVTETFTVAAGTNEQKEMTVPTW